MAQAGKFWLTLYSIVTAVCYLFDGLCFISAFRWFSVPGDEHSELLLLMATLINFSIDVYYFIWVLNLKQKLPPKIGSYVSDAVLGLTSKLSRELFHNLDHGARAAVPEARKKLRDIKEEAKAETLKAKQAIKNKKSAAANKKKQGD